MPLYDYECTGCANIDEFFHGMHEDPIILCPICESRMERVILAAPAGFVPCQTLGSLAERNAARMSQEEKDSISPRKKSDIKKIKRRLRHNQR